jgi:hypothetical protein
MPSCCSWVLKKLFYYMKIIMNLHCEYWKVCFFVEFRSDQFVASHIMPTSIRRLTTRDSYPCWARRWHNWPKHIYSAWFICRTQ